MTALAHLRPAQSLDAGALGAVMSAAAATQPWRPRLYSMAEDVAHVATMIERGWVTVADTAPAARCGFLARDGAAVHALYIAPDAQRAGIGRALIADAQRHATQLHVWVHTANGPARALYHACGFRDADNAEKAEDGLQAIQLAWRRPEPT